MLWKDNLNGIMVNFDVNFTNEGENILKKAVSDERMIKTGVSITVFFKEGDSITENFEFSKRFGTLHDLLIDLINEEISTYKAVQEQNEMINKVEELKDFISLEEKSITNKITQSIKNYIKYYKENKNTIFFFFCRTKKSFKKCIKAVW